MSSLDCLDLCRLCLVKDSVSVPIFGGEGDARQIFLKIAACLPVKVARDDKLPKKICDQCVCKIELCYEFWNTTVNSEKQLIEWLGGSGVEDKQNYVSDVLNPNIMKQEQSNENRLDGTVMQVSGHQSNMAIGMMGNLALNMPIIISTSSQQQISSVPMDTSCNSVQAAQPLPGPSSQTSHSQNQVNSVGQEEEESTEEDDNTDDDGDAEEGLPVKEESEEDVNTNRSIEPTTFVNVSLACDEAGPSGLQQQKISEMPEMTISQTTDGDPKSGCYEQELEQSKLESVEILEDEEFIRYQSDAEPLTYQEISHQMVVTDSLEYLTEDSDQTNFQTKSIIRSRNRRSTKSESELIFTAIYECEICGKTMRNKARFLKHRLDHERISSESLPNQCEQCDKCFDNREKLKKHIIKAHQKEKPFQCALCGKCFKTEEFLKTHLRQHNKRFSCDICGISKVSGYDLRLHKKKHNQEYITHCEICSKGFYTNQTLERHLLTHTGEKPFICKICNTPYASAAYLNMHMRSHGQREKYKCTSCKFESYWKAALKVHLKIHTGENQITCEICGKSVSSKTYLQIHMRIHSGEKPHICEVCGKAFSVRKYLIVHLRTHTGERPYECKVCHKRFTQQGSLNSHMKSHNQLK